MNNFFKTVKGFFTAPVFEGDIEKTQAAKLLYQIIRIIWVLPILLVTIGILGGRTEVMPPAVVISISLLTLMVLSQIGWVGFASTFLTAMIVLLIGYADLQNAGNIQPSTLMFAIAIIMSGLLLGRRAPLVTAFLILVSHTLIVYFQMQGRIKLSSAPAVGVENIVITSIMILMIGFLFQFVVSRLQFALDQARKDEKELQNRNRELGELSKSLEQRVAERTKALAASAEISRRLTAILDPRQLASEVVNQVQTAFDYYYAQIYLFDDAGENLVLTAGTGEAGVAMLKRGHALPKGRGLVGRAAESNQSVLVSDTSQDPNWLPNELLPKTKAEAVVPIASGDQVLGVLDVQDDVTNDIFPEDITLLESLAGQVAISIQNARQYEETQRTTAQLSEALDIAKLANWEYDVTRDRFIFNDHFYSIFHTTAELEGGYELSSAQYAERLVHPDDLPIVGAAIEKALTSTDRHYSAQLEHRVLYRDGGNGYVSVNIHIERDGNGQIIRYYGANQDITERKRLEELMTQRARQLEMINVITQRIQTATTIETAMQIAARELGHALGMKQTLVALDPAALSGDSKMKKMTTQENA